MLTIGGTFVAFIPVEGARLLTKRGDDCRAYILQTPWRLVRRVW